VPHSMRLPGDREQLAEAEHAADLGEADLAEVVAGDVAGLGDDVTFNLHDGEPVPLHGVAGAQQLVADDGDAVVAGAEALDRDEAEMPVRGRIARFDIVAAVVAADVARLENPAPAPSP
jgi:hypothetical protein